MLFAYLVQTLEIVFEKVFNVGELDRIFFGRFEEVSKEATADTSAGSRQVRLKTIVSTIEIVESFLQFL